MFAQAACDGVDGEISRELEEVPRAFDEDRMEASLKEVSVYTVLLIERLAICPIQMPHSGRQIGVRRLHDQVVVIRHQAIAVTTPAPLMSNYGE